MFLFFKKNMIVCLRAKRKLMTVARCQSYRSLNPIAKDNCTNIINLQKFTQSELEGRLL